TEVSACRDGKPQPPLRRDGVTAPTKLNHLVQFGEDHDYRQDIYYAYPADRIAGGLGGCTATNAREGKGPDAGPRRPGRRTPAHALDGGQEDVRVRGAAGQVEPARPVRGPPAVDPLPCLL